MKVLLVEDDVEKSEILQGFLGREFPAFDVVTATSFDGGLRALTSSQPIDLMLLDMSMPSHEPSAADPQGGPEGYAGKELLAHMALRRIRTPTIVVTMFDAFGKGENRTSLDELKADLRTRFSPVFRGLVYYNVAQEGWRAELRTLIEGTLRESSSR